jgi:hypothetical protein
MASNGYVPSSDLVTVQSGIQLSRPTANAWFAMAAAASASGNRIGVASPAGGYRSYAVQADMRARPWLYNLNKQSTKSLARAGSSTHGYGTRVDVVGAVGWVIANGARWGFYREFGAADPNHFAHNGVTAITGTADVHLIERKDTMLIIVNNDTKARFLWVEGCFPYVISDDTSKVYTEDLAVLAKSTTGARYQMVWDQATTIAAKAASSAPSGTASPVITQQVIDAIAQRVIDFQKLPGN